jgi:hypothetical protein
MYLEVEGVVGPAGSARWLWPNVQCILCLTKSRFSVSKLLGQKRGPLGKVRKRASHGVSSRCAGKCGRGCHTFRKVRCNQLLVDGVRMNIVIKVDRRGFQDSHGDCGGKY